MNCKVIDNYLEEDIFQSVETYIKDIIQWEVAYKLNDAADKEEQFQFFRRIIEQDEIRYP